MSFFRKTVTEKMLDDCSKDCLKYLREKLLLEKEVIELRELEKRVEKVLKKIEGHNPYDGDKESLRDFSQIAEMLSGKTK